MHDAVPSHEVKHANAVRAPNRHCPNVKGQCEKNKTQEHIFPHIKLCFQGACMRDSVCVWQSVISPSPSLTTHLFFSSSLNWPEHWTYCRKQVSGTHLCSPAFVFCFYFLWVFHVTHHWSLMFSFHLKSPGSLPALCRLFVLQHSSGHSFHQWTKEQGWTSSWTPALFNQTSVKLKKKLCPAAARVSYQGQYSQRFSESSKKDPKAWFTRNESGRFCHDFPDLADYL